MNGDLLREHLKEKNITIKTLAQAINLSRQSVHAKLSGKVPVTTKEATAIVQALNLSDEEALELFLREE